MPLITSPCLVVVAQFEGHSDILLPDGGTMNAIQSVEVPGPPAILYKYFPPKRIDVLEDMQVCFSRPSAFNDTFDSRYLVPSARGAKDAIAARFRLMTQLGVLCLTEQPDNQLMWVHYAQNHAGFALGFNANASFFREDNRTFGKVVYRDGPKVLSEADLNVCFYKPEVWKYEKEWRCVRLFKSVEPRLVTIEPSLISQIILGHQMEAWQIARIVQYAKFYEMTHVQFLVSTPKFKSWTIENRPKTLSVCPSCDGSGYLMEDSKD
jgi:hypothetical protein